MKILIADDTSTMRSLLLSGLTRIGYDVEVAVNGDHAWSILQRPDAPEIAILDWMMPELTGVEVCQKLRQRQGWPYVYVILLTGMDGASDEKAALDAGADDYMTKPFKPVELAGRLRNGERVLQLQRELQAAQAEIVAAAERDSLTRLANRRVIRAGLDHAYAKALGGQESLGAILLEIDQLQQINELDGEVAGDMVLQQVAARLSESVRPQDSVGRFAGNRFLLVIPASNMYETVMLAERIRKSFSDTPIRSLGEAIAISASFGVCAGTAEPDRAAPTWIAAARRALERAKAAGGNRVYLAASDAQSAALVEKPHGSPAAKRFSAGSDKADGAL